MLKKIAAGLLGALTALSVPLAAFATPINPHSYNLRRTYSNVPISGLFFRSPQTGEDIYNNAGGSQLITKEAWLNLAYYSSGFPEWLEVGTIKANVVTDFNAINTGAPSHDSEGIFIAYNNCLNLSSQQCTSFVSLREKSVSDTATGMHTFIIRSSLDTPNTWDVYIDYNRTAQISKDIFISQTAQDAMVGIESSDNANSYRSGTSVQDFWWVDPASESNKYTGWNPVNPNVSYPQADNTYAGNYTVFSYPVDNGMVVAGDAVTQSNTIYYYHN